MTNQNVVVSDAKSGMSRVKITVTLSDNSIFPTPAATKILPSPRGSGRYITISRKDVPKRIESGGKEFSRESGNKITAWVDSMRDCSPPRVKSSVSSRSETETDHEQTSWMARHPSALMKFEEIVSAAKGKKLVVFLDYDGTLAPIVEDPDRAFMTTEMREAVKDVARYFPTAIVTGRCRDKVFSFVKLSGLYYAGSHGMDIEGPTKSCKYKKGDQGVLFQPASEFLPMIDEVYNTLVEKTRSIPGAKVENNKFCVSVHFRCVDEKSWATLAEQVRLVLNQYPKLKLTQGRKVFEIRPTIKWDKGKALEFLLKALGYANSKDVIPVYIGDDRTDEDAFKVLRNKGRGIGILVSKVAKETNANYSLQEPSEVKEFLQRLVQWRRISLRQH